MRVLIATDANLAVRVSIRFVATPERTMRADARSTVIEGQASVASADPSDPLNGARCQ